MFVSLIIIMQVSEITIKFYDIIIIRDNYCLCYYYGRGAIFCRNQIAQRNTFARRIHFIAYDSSIRYRSVNVLVVCRYVLYDR